jgi:hypothetical protein
VGHVRRRQPSRVHACQVCQRPRCLRIS